MRRDLRGGSLRGCDVWWNSTHQHTLSIYLSACFRRGRDAGGVRVPVLLHRYLHTWIMMVMIIIVIFDIYSSTTKCWEYILHHDYHH
jgi:hypothetical protein